MTYLGTYAYLTDIGKVRTSNQDAALVMTNSDHEVFMLVCDGMGGMEQGGVASRIAVESLAESFSKKRHHNFAYFNKVWLESAVKRANRNVNSNQDATEDGTPMGTTLVCALIVDERLFIVNIGDSRAYRVTMEEIEQLTEDETYVEFLLRSGKITEEQAKTHPDRHVLMNALGVHPSVSFSVQEFPYRGETLLLCSDGLYNLCSESEIQGICLTDERADQKANSLIHAANSNGGSDNIAVSYWETINHD